MNIHVKFMYAITEKRKKKIDFVYTLGKLKVPDLPEFLQIVCVYALRIYTSVELYVFEYSS